jgi:hypothetical protein
LGETASMPLIKSGGWWTLNHDKLKQSTADLWVLVLYGFSREHDFVVIEPGQLLQRYERLGKMSGTIQSYVWVTKDGRCWETRGLGRVEQNDIATGNFQNDVRNLTPFLNNWRPLETRIR